MPRAKRRCGRPIKLVKGREWPWRRRAPVKNGRGNFLSSRGFNSKIDQQPENLLGRRLVDVELARFRNHLDRRDTGRELIIPARGLRLIRSAPISVDNGAIDGSRGKEMRSHAFGLGA